MTLPVAQLKDMLSSPSDRFEISAATLAVADAEPLFTDLLGGDLVLEAAHKDSARLTARGTLAVDSEELAGLPAVVRFVLDDEGALVSGLEIAVRWPTWEIKTSFLTSDIQFLEGLGFSGACVVLEAAPDGFGSLVPAALPGAALAVGDDLYVKFVDAEDPERITVLGEFGDDLSFGSLDALAGLPFVGSGVIEQFTLPEPVRSALTGILVTNMSATFDRFALVFPDVSVDLALDVRDGWTLIDNLLTLNQFSGWLRVVREPGSAPVLTGGLGAALSAGSVSLTAGVTLPDMIVSATADHPEGGDDLVSGHLPDDLQRAVTELDHLYVRCDAVSRDYLLVMGLDLDWAFTDGIRLTGLILELAGKGTAAPDVTLIGTLALGETDVVVFATRTSAGVWQVSASAEDIPFDGFTTWMYDAFSVRLPKSVADLHLSEVSLSFTDATSGVFTCSGRLPLGEGAAESSFRLRAEISRTQGGDWSPGFEADLEILVDLQDENEPHLMTFAVDLGSDGTGTRLTATWNVDRPMPLFAVLRALGLAGLGDVEEALPATLRPDLRGLTIVYDSATGRTVVSATVGPVSIVVASARVAPGVSTWAAQVTVAVRAGVSQLPLLGGLVPPGEDLGLGGVRVVASGRPVPPELLVELNEALAAAAPEAPILPVLDAKQGGLPGGTWLALEYVVPGSTPALLATRLGGPRPPVPPATPAKHVLEGVVLAPGETAPPAAEGRAGAWVELGRKFGPLLVHRVGVAYEAGTVWLMIDGALNAGGFTMAAQGLALGVDLDADGFPVRARLSGLAVEFDRPPLRIAGALIDRTPPPDGFEMMVGGMLVVQLPRVGITAVGAYQRRDDGMPSLFVFGRATARLGGPPPFRVTDLAAGFGFNSSLRVPDPTEVSGFPLVAGLSGGLPDDAMGVLDELTGSWVSPRQGQIWGAAGIDFTSFEFITGRLLLLLEAGNDLTIALLGTARAAFPRTGRAIAQIALQLRIVYRSSRGEFAATALLYDSYVIDPSCVLTGGFAFFMWFGNSGHAGDFALTAGGYHPLYEAPAHYPRVPRLGFTWSLGAVDISGTAFFALTPSAVMAGGTLDVRYSSGALKAWLTAYAHLLISWKPLYFRAGIGISIGASLKVWFATLRGELSAKLELWGPPTGGKVTAKFTFIKVTIGFGSGSVPTRDLKWPEFTELLPPSPEVLKIAVSAGLLADAEPPQGRAADDPDAPWLVDASGFTFVAESAVPSSELVFQDREPEPGYALDIRPMGETGKTSVFTVRVARNTRARGAEPRWEALENDGSWQVEKVEGAVPAALWGPPGPSDDDVLCPEQRLLPGRTTGLKVTVPPPVTTGEPLGPIAEASLAYEEMPEAAGPLDPADPPTGDRLRPAPGTGVGIVVDGIAADAAVGARGRLAGALAGLLAPLPDAPLRAFADHAAAHGLPADPLILEPAAARDGNGTRPLPVASA